MSTDKNATFDNLIAAAFPAPVSGKAFRDGLRLLCEGARVYGAAEARAEGEDKAYNAYKRGVLDGREEHRTETELRASGRKPWPVDETPPAHVANGEAMAPSTDPQPTCERSWQIGYSRGKAEGEEVEKRLHSMAAEYQKQAYEIDRLRKELAATEGQRNRMAEEFDKLAHRHDSVRALLNVARNL